MPVEFLASQTGLSPAIQDPLPYTGGPLYLLWADLLLILRCMPTALGIFLPLNLLHPDIRDELYPGSWRNLFSLFLHVVLVFMQASFLISLISCLFVPLGWFIVYVAFFMLLNYGICWFLNGSTIQLVSQVEVENEENHASEYWVYLNGVSVGRDWLQSNVDRLSETFGRRVHGVHNPTDGIIFDLIQCLVQRNFSYSTQDVRDGYALIKEALLNEDYTKIVFILHSQGGIEGGLIVDWLLNEIPQDLLHRLEIYTFGNAANHFNNPHKSSTRHLAEELEVTADDSHSAIRHIEHYANSGDFVSRFGVLSFISVRNRFMGRLFQGPGSGHLLNQHYLSEMFPLDENRKASEENAFMDMEVTFSPYDQKSILRESVPFSFYSCADRVGEADVAFVGDVNTPITPVQISSPNSLVLEERTPRTLRVRDFSRLWKYRNGMSPES
ncbi:hypothetical protein NA57DRAFT_42495 [Rhizodiscina lignyota]|uniref:Uncharacterized protein n=1 Tax=Rhizodiscina lignyota TaxID=1504668 RepID=A0A9P4M6P9_9PEZI|nr:hypothetical protein NA57DRAFT_42495 [Rhizodiscina lignyota]